MTVTGFNCPKAGSDKIGKSKMNASRHPMARNGDGKRIEGGIGNVMRKRGRKDSWDMIRQRKN